MFNTGSGLKKLFVLIVFVFSVVSVSISSHAGYDIKHVAILHTGNINGVMEASEEVYDGQGKLLSERKCGFSAISSYRKAMVTAYGKGNVDLVNTGDTVLSSDMKQVMKRSGYNVLSSDLSEKDSEHACFSYRNTYHKGFNIAYINVSGNLTEKSLYNKVTRTVKKVRSRGADYIVVMANPESFGYDLAWDVKDLVKNISGADLVLGGYGSEVCQRFFRDADGHKVFVSQAGCETEHLGKILLTIDEDTDKVISTEVKMLEPRGDDPRVSYLIKDIMMRMGGKL